MKKICTFRSQKGNNRLQEPKTEFGAQNQYGRVIYIHRLGILHGARKNIILYINPNLINFIAEN
jgi:hypothetical protein